MKAKIHAAGCVKVHKRPASAVLVEPDELWPGYNVEVIGEYQGKQHLWLKIYYLYNGAPYTGWVISEGVETEPLKPLPTPQILRHDGADFFVSIVLPTMAFLGLGLLIFILIKAF